VDESGYARWLDPDVYPEWGTIPEYYRRRDQLGPIEVPAGHLFCLGDNRDNSHDSRYWGPIPRGYVKGRALIVYWSVIGEEHPEEGFREGEGLTQWLRRTSRWDRIFSLVR
jgi:signal peptidase I